VKALIFSLWFFLLSIVSSQATTIYPWESIIGGACSSVSTGTDHMLCLDSTSFVLYKCQSSDGTCLVAVNGYQWTGLASTITTSKNVGIGSLSPGQLLDIQGTVRIIDSTATVGIGTFSVGNELSVQGTLSNAIFFSDIPASGTEGNVGIGSARPGFKLDVSGGIRNSGSGTSLFGSNVGINTANPAINGLDIATTLSIGTAYATYFTAPTNGLIVQGNVGIGSTTPGQAVDVNGTIRALSSGACSYIYKCVGGVDAGVIQTSTCGLCPGGSCTQMNGCF
jgi:hypothetical protein